MGLKEALTRIKRLERVSGLTDREQQKRDVIEIIKCRERDYPEQIQETLWSIVQLSQAEIRAMGRGEKTIEDFRDRFKWDYDKFMQGIYPPRETQDTWTQGRELAIFSASRGEKFHDYFLTDEDRMTLGLDHRKAVIQ